MSEDVKVEVVTLEWEECELKRRSCQNPAKVFEGKQCAVYAFEGKHNAYPYGAILYIGKTWAASWDRPMQSAKGQLYANNVMYPCYWDMVCRWAVVKEAEDELTTILERILIHAIQPVLNFDLKNTNYPKGVGYERYRKLIVCNKGDKGPLLPVLYGNYFG